MPDTKRTDTELVALYSEEVARVYQEAKAIAGLAPRNCLLDLRRLIESIVAELAKHFGLPVEGLSLNERIQKIRREKLITPSFLDRIDEIRKKSNSQIHRPVEMLDNSGDDQALAEQCLKLFCDVIATYRAVVKCEADNGYHFVPDGTADLMKICYEAFFKETDDRIEGFSTRYRLARVLLEDLYRNAGNNSSNFEFKISTYIKLVELGARTDGWHEAVCDYARLKLYGNKLIGYEAETDNEELNKVVDQLRRYSEEIRKENMTIKVLYAQAVILKGYGEQWDKGPAYDALKQAVDARDAEAIKTLAIMYNEGFLVEKDPEKAFELFAEAAKMGDASALFVMGKMQLAQKNWHKALQSYSAAIEQGLHTAYLEVARIHVKLSQHKKAIEAYNQYLKSRFTFDVQHIPAMLELGEQIILDADGDTIGILEGLGKITAVVQIYSPTPEQEAQANRIASIGLKLLKGRITSDIESMHIPLLDSFDCQGKIKSFENTWPNGLPPDPDKVYDFNLKRNPAGARSQKKQKIGRNDPCPCGSGDKYKSCRCTLAI